MNPMMTLAPQTDSGSIKVHTSLNRAAQLPPCHTSGIRRSDWDPVCLWPEAGHIVGFYGIVVSFTSIPSGDCNYADLRAISEQQNWTSKSWHCL